MNCKTQETESVQNFQDSSKKGASIKDMLHEDLTFNDFETGSETQKSSILPRKEVTLF